ncbi:methyl-accepting chemotaxis protein [Paenibacillus sp. IITD108]|uniref:methyl-accepting chemotaxis protein n=1 Tax=Paenibacillus sp. IITD108 TaxID=3116649 RepID=UPI002F3E79C8
MNLRTKMKSIKLRSIRSKLTLWFLVVALIPLISSSFLTYSQSSQELVKNQKESFKSIVESQTKAMDQWLYRHFSEITLSAMTDTLRSMNPEWMTPYLTLIKDQSDVYESVGVTGKDGIIVAGSDKSTLGMTLEDRDYFQAAMKGESYYSDIIISKSTNNRIIVIASPITDTDKNPIGVLYASLNFEAFIGNFIHEVDPSTYIILVDKLNQIQHISDADMIGKSVDGVNFSQKYADILKNTENKVGVEENTEDGIEYLIAFSPVKETGYNLFYSMKMNDVLASANKIQFNMFIIMSIAAAIVIILAVYVSGTIAKPIKKVTERVKLVSAGDLTGEPLLFKSKDEIGQLGNHIQTMSNNLRDLIGKVAITSEQVAASSEELTASAEETSKATDQITVSAQTIASGAEQQVLNTSSSKEIVSQMSSSILHIKELSKHVTELSDETVQTSENGNQVVRQSIEQMKYIEETTDKISVTVNELSNKSTEIDAIISVITDISSQTNLLALNAAIEAARAGEQGRGFAVVANEVRKLAEQSGRAAEQIRELIHDIQTDIQLAVASMQEGSVAVHTGTKLSNEAGQSFTLISHSISQVYGQIQEIASAIKQLHEGSNEMVASIDLVQEITSDFSGSTQEVAAAAEEQNASMEEIAAASNMLAKMAEELQSSVKLFKI